MPPEPSLVRRARELVPAMTVLKLFEIMSASGMIKPKRISAGGDALEGDGALNAGRLLLAHEPRVDRKHEPFPTS